MVEVKDNIIKIGTSTIYYRIAGNSKAQTMIFLHGWPGTYLKKSGVIEELAKQFYVISPEHPGLGRSDPLENYTNIFEQYADVLYKILAQEKRHKIKSYVMGQSFGGGVASAFAYKYPSNTKALILTDSIMGACRHDLLRQFFYAYGASLAKTVPSLPFFLKKIAAYQSFGVSLKTQDDWHKINKTYKQRVMMIKNFADLTKKALKENKNFLDKNYDDFPIIMLWGDRDGKEFNFAGYCPVDDAKKLAHKMNKDGKEITFLTVPGGHPILYQNPKMVISKIMQYLN